MSLIYDEATGRWIPSSGTTTRAQRAVAGQGQAAPSAMPGGFASLPGMSRLRNDRLSAERQRLEAEAQVQQQEYDQASKAKPMFRGPMGSVQEAVGLTANAAIGIGTDYMDLAAMAGDALRYGASKAGLGDFQAHQIGDDSDNPWTRWRRNTFAPQSQAGEMVSPVLRVGAHFVSGGWMKSLIKGGARAALMGTAAKGGTAGGYAARTAKWLKQVNDATKVAPVATAGSGKAGKLLGAVNRSDDYLRRGASGILTRTASRGRLAQKITGTGKGAGLARRGASVLDAAVDVPVGALEAVKATFRGGPVPVAKKLGELIVFDAFADFMVTGRGEAGADETFGDFLTTIDNDLVRGLGELTATDSTEAEFSLKFKAAMEGSLMNLLIGPMVDGFRISTMARQFRRLDADDQARVLERLGSGSFDDFAAEKVRQAQKEAEAPEVRPGQAVEAAPSAEPPQEMPSNLDNLLNILSIKQQEQEDLFAPLRGQAPVYPYEALPPGAAPRAEPEVITPGIEPRPEGPNFTPRVDPNYVPGGQGPARRTPGERNILPDEVVTPETPQRPAGPNLTPTRDPNYVPGGEGPARRTPVERTGEAPRTGGPNYTPVVDPNYVPGPGRAPVVTTTPEKIRAAAIKDLQAASDNPEMGRNPDMVQEFKQQAVEKITKILPPARVDRVEYLSTYQPLVNHQGMMHGVDSQWWSQTVETALEEGWATVDDAGGVTLNRDAARQLDVGDSYGKIAQIEAEKARLDDVPDEAITPEVVPDDEVTGLETPPAEPSLADAFKEANDRIAMEGMQAAGRAVEGIGRIRQILDELADESPGGRVRIADVRKALPDVPKEEVDQALKQMARDKSANLMFLERPADITPEDAEAAVNIAGQPQHVVYPSRRKGRKGGLAEGMASDLDQMTKSVGRIVEATDDYTQKQAQNLAAREGRLREEILENETIRVNPEDGSLAIKTFTDQEKKLISELGYDPDSYMPVDQWDEVSVAIDDAVIDGLVDKAGKRVANSAEAKVMDARNMQRDVLLGKTEKAKPVTPKERRALQLEEQKTQEVEKMAQFQVSEAARAEAGPEAIAKPLNIDSAPPSSERINLTVNLKIQQRRLAREMGYEVGRDGSMARVDYDAFLDELEILDEAAEAPDPLVRETKGAIHEARAQQNGDSFEELEMDTLSDNVVSGLIENDLTEDLPNFCRGAADF